MLRKQKVTGGGAAGGGFLAENLRARRVPSRPEGSAKLFSALPKPAGQPPPRAAPLGNIQDAAEARMLLKSPQTILAKAGGGKHGELAKVLPQGKVCRSRPVQQPNHGRPPPAAPRPTSPGASAPHGRPTSREAAAERRPRAAPSSWRARRRANFSAYGKRRDPGGKRGEQMQETTAARQAGAGRRDRESCSALPAAPAEGAMLGSGGARAPAPARILTHLGAVGSVLRHFPP